MKKVIRFCGTILFAIFALSACQATQTVKSSVSSGMNKIKSSVSSMKSKIKSITSHVDENLYAQVPDHQREGVQKYESDLIVAQEELRLQEYINELSKKRSYYSEYKVDIAEQQYEIASLARDVAKQEAISRSGIGNREEVIKSLTDLKAKKLRMEAEKVTIEGKLSTTGLRIEDSEKEIKEQEALIKRLKAEPVAEEPQAAAEKETARETPGEGKTPSTKTEEGKKNNNQIRRQDPLLSL